MGKKTSLKTIIGVTAAAITGMYVYNRIIAKTATKNNRLPATQGEFYDWKYGSIYYSKKGSGSPLLLVHDTDPAGSAIEWCKISQKLAKDHTVYCIDLLGCGRSDKPGLEYNNYLYVQMIKAFIQNVIGEKTDVIASNISTSFILTANNLDPELFDHIILINPVSIKELEMIPDFLSKTKKVIMNLPIIGTFIYNLLSTPLHIDQIFRDLYYSRKQLINIDLKEAYYESAHLKESHGKYLLASLRGNYMHVNIHHALEMLDKPVCIIGSREIDGNIHTIEQYEKANPNFDVTMLSGAKSYPHLEIPEKTIGVIRDFLAQEL